MEEQQKVEEALGLDALEPFYGRPELNPILSSLLGKFGVRKGRAA